MAGIENENFGAPQRWVRKVWGAARRCALPTMLFVTLGLGASACGGGGSAGSSSTTGGSSGGSNGGGTQTPPPDFTLSVAPASISIAPGSSGMISVLATASNGFSGTVTTQTSDLPSGVSLSPASLSLQPGTAQTMQITVAPSAVLATTTLLVTATSGTLSHTAPLALAVVTATRPTRTNYVFTNAAEQYLQDLNEQEMAYLPTSGRLFVSDAASGHLFVIDAGSQTLLASIPVPGVWGIDATADESTIWAGTTNGDVYTIDTQALQVTRRYPANSIGPAGFRAITAVAMTNGLIGLLGEPAGTFASVDGYNFVGVWNPSTNALTVYVVGNPGLISTAGFLPACGSSGNIGLFTRTLDRTRLLLRSIDSDGTMCTVNAETGAQVINGLGGINPIVAQSPDGQWLAAIAVSMTGNPTQLNIYSSTTLAVLRSINLPTSTFYGNDTALIFSADSSTLFFEEGGSSNVIAYSAFTGAETGWLPNVDVQTFEGGATVGPPGLLLGTTGMAAIPAEEGVDFLDLAAVHFLPVVHGETNGYLSNVVSGPVAGGTAVTWTTPNPFSEPPASVFFGAEPAANVSGSDSVVNAVTPPGPPGPVNVFAYTGAGEMQLLAQAFSYGPWIREATPNAATTDGGGVGLLFGYGFGPANVSSSSTAAPAGVSVTVGGTPATLLSYSQNVYGEGAPPFPLEGLAFVAPPAAASGPQDIVVTTAAGSNTARGGLTYFPAPQTFAASGAALIQGVYDPHRDLYYFTDLSHIRVFSRSLGAWQAPIPIPAPAGVGAQRLWGIALSPDGNTLVVTDHAANYLYVLNPGNPAQVQSYALLNQFGGETQPTGVVVTNSGMVYYAASVAGGSGFSDVFQFDLTTQQGKAVPNSNDNGTPTLHLALSSDGSSLYFNEYGALNRLNTATGTVAYVGGTGGASAGDLTAGPAGLVADGLIFDANLDQLASYSLDIPQLIASAGTLGVKESADGSLIFQPEAAAIDAFNGNTGQIVDRIALPFGLSTQYDALVSDGSDNILVAITGNGNGIAIIDLSAIQ